MSDLLTAKDVEVKIFKKVRFGGYAVAEVEDFLNQVADDLEAYAIQLDEKDARILELETWVKKQESMADMIKDALIQARKSAKDMEDQANQSSGKMLEDARNEADRLLNEAEDHVQDKLDEAGKKAAEIISQARTSADGILKEVQERKAKVEEEITGIEQELGTKRREAQSQADEILSTTRAEARRMIADAEQEIEACKNELRFLSLRKQQFLKDTSSFLDEFSKIIDKAQSDCERDFYNDDNANQNSIQNQSLNFNPDTVHLDKDYDGEFVYDENLQPQYQEQAPEQEQELDYGYNHNGEYSDMDNDSISEQK